MSDIEFLLSGFHRNKKNKALVHGDLDYSYGELEKQINHFDNLLTETGVKEGDVVLLVGDYSLQSIALFLSLTQRKCIIIPLTQKSKTFLSNRINETIPDWVFEEVKGSFKIKREKITGNIPVYYKELRSKRVPGLVMFTSGSSGAPKAVVHNFSKLLKKFHTPRPTATTLNFLLFDHWGGLNTLFYGLSNQCTLVFPQKRSADEVCRLVETNNIELLPATPSFLNILLISGCLKRYNLSSLKVISYGAEPMPKTTLAELSRALPNIQFKQTYGMIELGVLRAKTKDSKSLWVKVGGEGYQLRVVDNILQIKADSAMMGYINAPSPFTSDGYLITGDLVEQDGEWLKILGRQSDIINVGGEKVYPSEVEAILLEHSDVVDANVFGEKHPLLGQIVCSQIVLKDQIDKTKFREEILKFCGQRMKRFMIPMKFDFVNGFLQSDKLKRVRKKINQ